MCDMGPVKHVRDLVAAREKVEGKLENLRKESPKLYATLQPLVDDLLEWLEAMEQHTARLSAESVREKWRIDLVEQHQERKRKFSLFSWGK